MSKKGRFSRDGGFKTKTDRVDGIPELMTRSEEIIADFRCSVFRKGYYSSHAKRSLIMDSGIIDQVTVDVQLCRRVNEADERILELAVGSKLNFQKQEKCIYILL